MQKQRQTVKKQARRVEQHPGSSLADVHSNLIHISEFFYWSWSPHLLSVLYLWYLVAVPFYISDPRDIPKEGQTEIVRVVRRM